MCGKYVVVIVSNGTESGSPPHVREIHISSFSLASSIRITPACAGNTRLFLLALVKIQDHPRMCGKYEYSYTWELVSQGSPPHVREIPPACNHFCGFRGITPACAGNTWLMTKNLRRKQDHPRMCGKYQGYLQNHNQHTGSPPHVREILYSI